MMAKRLRRRPMRPMGPERVAARPTPADQVAHLQRGIDAYRSLVRLHDDAGGVFTEINGNAVASVVDWERTDAAQEATP